MCTHTKLEQNHVKSGELSHGFLEGLKLLWDFLGRRSDLPYGASCSPERAAPSRTPSRKANYTLTSSPVHMCAHDVHVLCIEPSDLSGPVIINLYHHKRVCTTTYTHSDHVWMYTSLGISTYTRTSTRVGAGSHLHYPYAHDEQGCRCMHVVYTCSCMSMMSVTGLSPGTSTGEQGWGQTRAMSLCASQRVRQTGLRVRGWFC